jgi:site-specific recombinase XerD
LIESAWVPETFRSYRRSLRIFNDYLREHQIDREELLEASRAEMHVVNFLAQAEQAGTQSPAVLATTKGHLLTIFRTTGTDSRSSLTALASRALGRRAPAKARRYHTIWNLDRLLGHLRRRFGTNSTLTDKQLQVKAMLLTMIFSLCRLEEIARMRAASRQQDTDAFVLVMTQKQSQDQMQMVPLRTLECAETCPVRALQEWAARGHGRPPGYLFLDWRTGRKWTRNRISNMFLRVMHASRIPAFYGAYSIKHATVTALSRRGATMEQIIAAGRWAPGSRTPQQYYDIPTLDHEWLGNLLVKADPAGDVQTQPPPEEEEEEEGTPAEFTETEGEGQQAAASSTVITAEEEEESEETHSSSGRRSGAAPPRM